MRLSDRFYLGFRVGIERVFDKGSVMDTLTIELPTTPDDWSGVTGRDLDAKLRELDVAARRIEAATGPCRSCRSFRNEWSPQCRVVGAGHHQLSSW